VIEKRRRLQLRRFQAFIDLLVQAADDVSRHCPPAL
jgi:hypothetical protein